MVKQFAHSHQPVSDGPQSKYGQCPQSHAFNSSAGDRSTSYGDMEYPLRYIFLIIFLSQKQGAELAA